MSDRNVEIVRAAWKAWGENPDLDGFLALLHEDIEWHAADDELDVAPRRGVGEVRARIEDWMSVFNDVQVKVEDFIEAGDHVIVPLRLSGRPRGVNAEITEDETWVIGLSDGKIREVREYRTIDAAFASLGQAGE